MLDSCSSSATAPAGQLRPGPDAKSGTHWAFATVVPALRKCAAQVGCRAGRDTTQRARPLRSSSPGSTYTAAAVLPAGHRQLLPCNIRLGLRSSAAPSAEGEGGLAGARLKGGWHVQGRPCLGTRDARASECGWSRALAPILC